MLLVNTASRQRRRNQLTPTLPKHEIPNTLPLLPMHNRQRIPTRTSLLELVVPSEQP